MKNLLIVAAAAAIACGCQTRITAEKFAETAIPVLSSDGATNDYKVVSGGWYVTARSPLWATESIQGLDVGTDANGAVHLRTDAYSRDLSTNAVTLTHNLVTDFTVLAEKAVLAYGTAGASLATAKAQTALKKGLAAYLLKGGSSGKATVTCADGTCTITDGSITECVNCSDN